MTATAHALVGALIAGKIGNPALALPLSFLSHFAGDILPHWDAGTNRRKKDREQVVFEAMLDVVAGFILSIVLYTLLSSTGNYIYLFACILASQAPDWLSAPFIFFRSKIRIFKVIFKIQEEFHNKLDKPWGIITQIVFLVVLYVLLYVIF